MNEKYQYTSRKCDECQGPVVIDIFKLEYYCLDCGLIQESTEKEEADEE